MRQNFSNDEYIALKKLSKNKDLIIHKSDTGNSVVVLDRKDYIKKINNILSDWKKFVMVNLKDDT